MAVIALFVLLEIAVLLGVGSWIGVGWTLLLMVATSALGIWLARTQGARALSDLTRAVRERRQPQNEVTDGLLIGGGAMLMVLPGFIGDLIGLALILPPTRSLVRRRLIRAAQAHAVALGVPGGGTVVDGMVDGGVGGDVTADRPGGARVGMVRIIGVGSSPDPHSSGPRRVVGQHGGSSVVDGTVLDETVLDGTVVDGTVVDGTVVDDTDARDAGGSRPLR